MKINDICIDREEVLKMTPEELEFTFGDVYTRAVNAYNSTNRYSGVAWYCIYISEWIEACKVLRKSRANLSKIRITRGEK